MNDEQRNLITAVIKTLNSIPVTGEDSMSKMLGSINALKQLLVEEAKEE